MTSVFHRYTQTHFPMAVGGEGPYLIDAQGKRYLDGSGGAAVSCLGHGHKTVKAAIKAQLDHIAFAHTGFFTSEPAEQLADFLVARTPGPCGDNQLSKVYFLSGGSEANEAAIKLARQYHVERGDMDRHIIIARHQSYHGNTLGALSAGGNKTRRAVFNPILTDNIRHIEPCYAYRLQQAGESDQAYALRAAGYLEQAILQADANKVATFIAEPVVGASLGCVPAVGNYFNHIRAICDRYGVLLILDEVMCGMGRTGALFAHSLEGVQPDMIAIAKGLGAGYQPIGALLTSTKVYNTIRDGSGFFQHGHTYVGHATACAAALAVQRVIEEEDLLQNVQAMGALLRENLNSRFSNHPHIGDIRGRGLFLGLEIVADLDSKRPFDPSLNLADKIKAAAMEQGLICYPGSGSVDGVAGVHILLAPAYNFTADHVGELVDKLSVSLDQVIPA